MEGLIKKYRQVSPERAKVWTEKSPKYHQQGPKVPVVYYLCRNRQLEHPHFIEVPLSSPDGLYLRDVIERLNTIRGRGMASMYSWSCKRSYKNGFVWHDVCEDDLILCAHGSEYVLKGSELFGGSNFGHLSPTANVRLQNLKPLPEPASSKSQDDSSSFSSMNDREARHSEGDERSLPIQHPGSSGVSPESTVGKKSPWNDSLRLAEYKIYKSNGSADASTQTEENVSRANNSRETCTRSVSTDDGTLETQSNENYGNQIQNFKEPAEIGRASFSSPPSTSSVSFSTGKTGTLESLIKADASKLNSFRILESEEFQMQSSSKLKASNMLMQMISCGSISVKDHKFGLIPAYRPRFSLSKFSSPLYSMSLMLGELDCLTENPRLMGLKEYFSGSLVERSMLKEEGVSALKRPSSYNADRASKHYDTVAETEETTSTQSKCIPWSIKASLNKQPRSESMRSPVSEGPAISSDGVDCSKLVTPATSTVSSKRFTWCSSEKNQSTRQFLQRRKRKCG